MKAKNHILTMISFFLLSSFVVSACASKTDTSTPTLSVEQVQTQAVATFSSGLTQTMAALPTMTSTLTPTSTPTVTNTPTKTLPTSTSVLPTSSCYSLAFISDVTIPDNTNMVPGEKFTKTWRVRNNGSCAWDAGFKLKSTGGNSLGGTALILTKDVNPGATTELSIFMTAPNKPGTYQSNWRMSNADGAYFGDDMYVIINVAGSTSTATSSPSPEPSTATATATATFTVTETEVPTDTPEP